MYTYHVCKIKSAWRQHIHYSMQTFSAKCQPGYFSTDGLAPCSRCPIGNYTDEEMQTQCTECPENYFTTNTGSTSLLDCITESMSNNTISYPACVTCKLNTRYTFSSSHWAMRIRTVWRTRSLHSNGFGVRVSVCGRLHRNSL